MEGRYCRVVALDADRHADDLFTANAEDREDRIWTYLPYGPFDSLQSYRAWIAATCEADDPLFHAVVDRHDGCPVGVASYLRITPGVGVIEVGHINYAPRLQGTAAATEAMYLMMARVFDEMGYRRTEWKCDALNAPSRRAAERLGFRFEGIFRQATVVKGRNRDTAWYSILDREWPRLADGFRAWLDPDNFGAAGRQIRRLEECFDASSPMRPARE